VSNSTLALVTVTNLAPDEGRILRLLATDGPQPSVDVRASNLIGVRSDLVAGGLNMIGAAAGLSRRDSTAPYLNNLERLGLIWFSREPLDNPFGRDFCDVCLPLDPDEVQALPQEP